MGCAREEERAWLPLGFAELGREQMENGKRVRQRTGSWANLSGRGACLGGCNCTSLGWIGW
jgi:hypothetical protein